MTLSNNEERRRYFEAQERRRYDDAKHAALEWYRANTPRLIREKISKEEGLWLFREFFLREYNRLYNLRLTSYSLDDVKKQLSESYDSQEFLDIVHKRDLLAGLVKKICEEEKLEHIVIGSSGMFCTVFKEKKQDVEIEVQRRTYWAEIRERTDSSSTQLGTLQYTETNRGAGEIVFKDYLDLPAVKKIKKKLGLFVEEPVLEKKPALPSSSKKWWQFWKK